MTDIDKKIDEILTRSVADILPSKDELKKVLLSGKKLRIYNGADATGSQLHIGHATNFILLEKLRQLGHEIIILFGDFTAMIGDPTDKTATRVNLTKKQVNENIKSWKEQVSKIIKFDGKNPARIVKNSEWLSKLTFSDVVDIASNFTVQQMIDREMFKRNLAIVKCEHCSFEWRSPIQFGTIEGFKSSKLVGNKTNCPKCGKITGLNKDNMVMKDIDQLRETPIGFHELLYPLMQGYDSVTLDVDMEVGGTDQTFNMLAGRTLQKRYNNKDKFVLTTTLLENPVSGEKLMSKSIGGFVALNDIPNDMFGKIMALPDEAIIQVFIDCTYVSMNEIKKMESDMKAEKINPRDLKLQLAEEIVKIYHGEKEAEKAKEYFVNTFSKKETPEDIKEIFIDEDIKKLTEFLVMSGNASSLSDARRKIEQGGVQINGKKETDWQRILNKKDSGSTLKIGKHGFAKIKFG